LRKGSSLLIPILLHGDQPAEKEFSLPTADLALKPDHYTFSFDLELPAPVRLDPFQPPPWRETTVSLTSFRARRSIPATYARRLQLKPLTNYYHVLTQTPAWVYSWGTRRTALPLADNRGVSVTGSVAVGASSYRLTVTNEHQTAQVLAYVPRDWSGARATMNGQPVTATTVRVRSANCLLLDLGPGRSEVTLTDIGDAGAQSAPVSYENPQGATWSEAAGRVIYSGLEYRAYEEDGKSCLELGGSGSAMFAYYPRVEAGGFSLQMQGQNSGGRLLVTMSAGDSWTYQIEDDFTGWREFAIRREQMATAGPEKKWEVIYSLSLDCQPTAGQTTRVANMHLLPPGPGDFPEQVVGKKRFVAQQAATPPVLNGNINQPCWQNAAVLTDFYGYSGPRVSESKTKVRVCYDSENLYIIFENLEAIDALGARQARDTAIWNTNHVELYLDPYRDGTRYTHLLVDPAGTIEDLQSLTTGRSHDWDGDYEVKTYLNWKASWVAEYKLPFDTLGKTPQPGDVWGINFARKDSAGAWSNWATYGEWLDPANFGEIQFGEAGAASVGVLRPPVDDPEVLLYASWDGTTAPEVQRGAGEAAASLDPQYTEGRRGMALVIGHQRFVNYPAAGNVKLAAGTISFWVKPLNWNVNQQLFHHFVSVQSDPADLPPEARPFSVLLYRFRDWDMVLAYGMQQWLAGEGLLEMVMDETWVPSQWHHVAFTWDQTEQTLSVDGRHATRKYEGKAPDVLNAASIKVGGPYYQGNEALTALDELRIYSRVLSPAELGQLYQAVP